MQTFKIFPVPKLAYFIEVVICSTQQDFGEFAPDTDFDEDDHSVFILNDSPYGDSDCLGTILFLEEALELGTIVHQSTRAGIAFGNLMLTLAGPVDHGSEDEEFFQDQTANITQELFNQIHGFVSENYTDVV